MEDRLRASIIIPCFNGEKTIRDCLNSVLAQDFDNYEVLVVDSSMDNTFKIIEKEFPRVKLYHFNDKKSVGEARNIGVEKSQGDYIFFTDVDCIVEKNWISEAIKLFEKNKDLMGLCLAIENYAEASIIETVDYLLEFYHWLPCQKTANNARYLLGPTSVYKKEAFFNNKFEDKNLYGQDVIFSAHLANKGYKLLFEPSIKIIHVNIKKSLLSFIKHQLKVGCGSANTRKKAVKSLGIFLKFPLLIFIAPLYIVPSMGLLYLGRKDFVNFIFFLKYLHLFFIGNLFWAIGFFTEATKGD